MHNCDACKTAPRKWLGPVGWLMGADLAASLQKIILASVTPRRFDLRDWMYASVVDEWSQHDFDQPFWFDYIADSGDGGAATYDIAYLCLSDLRIAASNETRGGYPRVDFELSGKPAQNDKAGGVHLPRGQFLLIGGDTAYHVADVATLYKRFKLPFDQAHRDVACIKRQMGARDAEAFSAELRPILGIPGNHDYYDHLNGFSLQFLKSSDSKLLSQKEKEDLDRLALRGFRRVQTASYAAVKLPFDWWLWAVDAESREKCHIDPRQRAFFSSEKAGCGDDQSPPSRLIVATASPTMVFGRKPRKSDDDVTPFKQLALRLPYLDTDASPVADGSCRLDLSGDVHHYTRYGGPAPKSAAPADELHAGATPPETPTYDNYASVVSGLGGAFLHPSHTDFGEIQPQRRYPTAPESRSAIAAKLFQEFAVWRRGTVPFIGLFLAIVFLLGSHYASPRRSSPVLHFRVLDSIARLMAGDRSAWPELGKDLGQTKEIFRFLHGVCWLALFLTLAALLPSLLKRHLIRGFAQESRWYYVPSLAAALIGLGGFFIAYYIANQETGGLALGTAIALLLLGLFAALAVYFPCAVGSSRHSLWERICFFPLGLIHFTMQVFFPITFVKIVEKSGYWALSSLPVMAAGWFLMYKTHGWSNAPRFRRLGWIGSVMIWLAVIGLLLLPGLLCDGGAYRPRTPQEVPAVAASLWIFVVVALCITWVRTRDRQPGAVLLQRAKKAAAPLSRLAKKVLVGLSVPALAGVVAIAVWDRNRMLELSVLENFKSSGDRYSMMTEIALAGVAGLSSVVWFTFYLAICDLLNAHNNEVGGATRVEAYKQFTRIKLSQDQLTAYVIGIKEPQACGCRLEPFLIDSFTLRPSPRKEP